VFHSNLDWGTRNCDRVSSWYSSVASSKYRDIISIRPSSIPFKSFAIHCFITHSSSSAFCFGRQTLSWSWCSQWFRNSKYSRGGVVSPMHNTQPGGPGNKLRLSWVALPGACDPSSTGARKPPLLDKVVVLVGAPLILPFECIGSRPQKGS
jgi:hypothetical protein